MRGLAHFTRGSIKQAIADASAAIRLDPNASVSFRVRGLAHLYADDPRSAADDFADAVRLAPSDAVGVIMLHVARVRVGHEDTQEFRANVAKVDRSEWPGPLVEVLTGESTVERVGDIAKSSEVEKTRRERLCDARVYFGLLQLTAGDKAQARKLFGAAAEDCPPGTTEAAERAVAKMELRQLGAASPRARPSRTPTPQMSEDSARRSR
jgi:lipoprotein NlpI